MANEIDLELEQDAQEYDLNIDDDTSRYLGLEFENEIDVINTGSSAKVYDGVLTLMQGETSLGTFSANSENDVTLTIDTTNAVTESSSSLVTSGAVYDAINTAIVEVENGTY